MDKELNSIHNEIALMSKCQQATEKEKKMEERTEFTDFKAKRNCSIDDSTDISAQITRRTNYTKNSNRREDSSSSQSMPAINLDNILKFKNECKMARESSEENSSNKAVEKPNRIYIQEYNQYLGEQMITDQSQDEDSIQSIVIVNNKESSEKSESEMNQYKRSIRQLKDDIANNANELGISSILENGEIIEETDILEYCAPNYATNTSKLFSTKDKEKQLIATTGSDVFKNSNDSRILVDIQNIESFSLGPSKIFKSKYFTQKESQKLVEELKSLEKENESLSSSYSKETETNCINKSGTPSKLTLAHLEKSECKPLDTQSQEVQATSRSNLNAKYMKELHDKMEKEKQEVLDELNSQKLSNKQYLDEIKKLKDELAKEKLISKQIIEKDEKYSKLQMLFNEKETEYTQNIEDLASNYEKQLDDKSNQIAFLRK